MSELRPGEDTNVLYPLDIEARKRFGNAAQFIGPNPAAPRWLLVTTAGLVGSTLGKGETPRAALDDAITKRGKAGA